MCLPIKFLKSFAFFSVFIEFGISILAFVSAYYINKLLNSVDDELHRLGIVNFF